MGESAASIQVAVVQFAPSDDRMRNRDRIAAFVAVAAARGARLVVFPEYSSYFVHPLDEGFARNAEPLDGDFVAALGDAAREHGVFVVAGLVERDAGCAPILQHAGRRRPVGRARRHVPQAAPLRRLRRRRESDWVVPGELAEPQIFDVDGVPVGLQTCYDIRFPEVTRRLVDAGAELVLVPAEWVRGPLKEHHWRTLLTARAIENTVYVAAADHAPPIGVGNEPHRRPDGRRAGRRIGETTDVAVAEVVASASRRRCGAVESGSRPAPLSRGAARLGLDAGRRS